MGQLFRITGFLSYLVMLFLNAFVDLGHKIIIQNTLFKTYDGAAQILFTAIVNALILLPFVLLLTPSGYLSDRFPKNQVMKTSAWIAVAFTTAITLFYYIGWFWAAFAMTFLLGAQAAIYSPAKYGFIKELVGTEALAAANGWVQATTTTAILAGIFVFSILFEQQLTAAAFTTPNDIMHFIAPLGWLLVLCSLIEVTLAYRLPHRAAQHIAAFDWAAYRSGRSLRDNLRRTHAQPVIWRAIIGLALFWAISQVLLAVFPAFAKDALGVTNTIVIQGMMACAGLGIIAGSIIAGRLSRGHIATALIPVGAIGVAITLFILPTLSSVTAHTLNFFSLGVLAGFLLVPLNALMQAQAPPTQLGRILAANNFIQNNLMLAFLVLTVAAAYFNLSSLVLLLALAVIAVIGAGYSLTQLPQALVRVLIHGAISARYRLTIIGLEQLPPSGGVLLLGNHVSWIDWALLQIASPRPVRFVMERAIYQHWGWRWLLDVFGVIPISRASSRQAIRSVAEVLDAGEVVCVFPEGTLSRNGQLSDFKRGFELAAQAAQHGVIVPFYQRGLWGSRFSCASTALKRQRRVRGRREVCIAFGQPLALTTGAETVKQAVFQLSVAAWQRHVAQLPTVPEVWLATASRQRSAVTVIDSSGGTLTNRRLITAVWLFAARLRQLVPEPVIGIALPPSSAGVIVNLAALALGKTVVNLNYTAGTAALRASVAQAGIRHVITAERFLRRLEQRGIDLPAALPEVTLQRLEILRAEIGRSAALTRLVLVSVLPQWALRRVLLRPTAPTATAAILFSSGSEGVPKGIELTHRNLVANVQQTAEVLNVQDEERVLANLPLFHAFGLTVTTVLPLLEGIPLICHPDPTDVLGTAKAIARHRATLFFSTATFLRLYVRHQRVDPLMLQSLRLVIAGAERLGSAVREAFALKFYLPIYEGYGATETTPVASVNVPNALDLDNWKTQSSSRLGTVGMPLPGTCFRIVEPTTGAELTPGTDGLILIGGVQVMRGYLDAPDKTAAVIHEQGGIRWYASGDKGHLDADGFLTIVDRYSRFAKIGGEMVSLSAVEDQTRLALAQPELELLAVAVPDERKGEQIVLLVAGAADVDALRRQVLAAGINPLHVPAVIQAVAAIPKLGSGKTDFGAARALVAAE